MYSVLMLIDRIIDIYVWVIILSAVLSWLVAFDIVNMRNRFVYLVGDALNRITERFTGRYDVFCPIWAALTCHRSLSFWVCGSCAILCGNCSSRPISAGDAHDSRFNRRQKNCGRARAQIATRVGVLSLTII